METDIRINIHTTNSYGNDSDETKQSYPGKLFVKNGKRYCVYNDEECSNTIKLGTDEIEILRKADGFLSKMFFKGGQTAISSYSLQGSTISMKVHTRWLGMEEYEDRIVVSIKYDLEMNGQFVSENNVFIEIGYVL